MQELIESLGRLKESAEGGAGTDMSVWDSKYAEADADWGQARAAMETAAALMETSRSRVAGPLAHA